MSNSVEFCFLKYEDIAEAHSIIIEANLNTFPFLVHNYISL